MSLVTASGRLAAFFSGSQLAVVAPRSESPAPRQPDVERGGVPAVRPAPDRRRQRRAKQSFRPPVPEVLERYTAGAEIFRTDRDGRSRVDSDGLYRCATFTGRRLSLH